MLAAVPARQGTYAHLFHQNPTSGVGNEHDRSMSSLLRLPGAGQFAQQLPGMREDVILQAQGLPVHHQSVVAPSEDPRVRT